jgi:protease-4
MENGYGESQMNRRIRKLGQVVLMLIGAAGGLAVGAQLFLRYPDSFREIVGILLAILVAGLGLRVAGKLAGSALATYDVAEVAVDSAITRDGGGGPAPTGPTGVGADEFVEQIERADEDSNVDALLVKLNTPGGEVVPSDDIRLAAEAFDGPTIAYTTDLCASGGYWIASGCDELWARKGSIVGSIGVIGSQVNATELADTLGLSYERLVAGEYKDAGLPLKEIDEEDREYLQGRIDGYYEQFVERVVEGRDLDESTVRDTEARVYLGTEALEMGLVDELGTRDRIEDRLADELGRSEVEVREFEPERGIAGRLRGGAATVAHAFGSGLATVLVDDGADVGRLE